MMKQYKLWLRLLMAWTKNLSSQTVIVTLTDNNRNFESKL